MPPNADDVLIDSTEGPYSAPSSESSGRVVSSVSDSSPSDVMDLSIQIQRCESWDELAGLCVRITRDLVGAIEVRWTEVSGDGRKALWACSASDAHAAYLRENLDRMLKRTDELGLFYQRVIGLLQGQSDDVLRLRNFLSPQSWHRNPYVRDFLTPVGVTDIVSMQVFCCKGGSVLLCVGMPEKEITKQQLADLKFIQHHIRVACSKLSRLASFTNLTGTFKQLWQQGGSVGISVLSKDGSKLWESDEASVRIIEELGGAREKKGSVTMPPELEEWAKSVLKKNTRICAQTNEYTKVFESTKGLPVTAGLLLERAGSGALLVVKRDRISDNYGGLFTRREMDIIGCIQRGLSSQAVSCQLHISKRTVDKHLENIYTKLGVNNRIAALKRLEELS